ATCWNSGRNQWVGSYRPGRPFFRNFCPLEGFDTGVKKVDCGPKKSTMLAENWLGISYEQALENHGWCGGGVRGGIGGGGAGLVGKPSIAAGSQRTAANIGGPRDRGSESGRGQQTQT